MRKTYVILPCSHIALLPKRWTIAVCATCGARFEAAALGTVAWFAANIP